jgi:hypothetical protein
VLLPDIALQPAPPVPIPQEPVRHNRAIGYGFMNLAFGLGSYIQGDILGGAIITGGWVVGFGSYIYAVTVERIDANFSPSVVYSVVFFTGTACVVGSVLLGFIRPIVYTNNRQLASVMDKVDIGLVSDENNKAGLRIGYKHSF